MVRDEVSEAFEKLKESVKDAMSEFRIVVKKNQKLRNSLGRYGKIGTPSGR